jgi:hypothetical protein
MQSPLVEHAIKQSKISLLRKLDPQLTKEKIMMLLTRCSQLVNAQYNLNALQIEFCAEQIMQNKWMYSLCEVQITLDNGAIGKYGTIYNRIDPATIMEWFGKYDQERQLIVESINQNQINQQNIYEIFNHAVMKEALEKTVDNLPKVELKTDTIERELSQFERLVLDEYDELPEWSENKQFKVYNNTPYLFTDYRKQRYDEEIKLQNEY